MFLMAGGVPVANGVFYYPQKSLWGRLDPTAAEANVYNRYQHLVFAFGRVAAMTSFRLESPLCDQVRVFIAPERFDFYLTGAEIVAAPPGYSPLLRRNSGLERIGETSDYCWFKVTENNN